ncbi:MAG TPA: 2Fe-2S iron-sulfur cluster-binding protein [Burkholderiaceae bacterium]|nr:2Fe-2S iron-sulfur cluster-binding protein [Burkholderiaceae bacterium]
MPRPTQLNIMLNGTPKSVPVTDGSEPLLFVLRNKLDQVGPKIGCGAQQCGVCTVLVNGAPIRACCAEVQSIPGGADVRTLDGLAEKGHGNGKPRLHALQRAFIEEQAAQCAFCSNGMIMSALAWLNGRAGRGERDVPSDDEVKRFLSGKGPGAVAVTLCRCGAHLRIVRAIQRAAKEMRRGEHFDRGRPDDDDCYDDDRSGPFKGRS